MTAKFYNDFYNEDEANALIKGLLENRSLTELGLQYSNIGPRGANTIAEALLKNDSLTSLDLSENRLSDGETYSVSMTRVQVGRKGDDSESEGEGDRSEGEGEGDKSESEGEGDKSEGEGEGGESGGQQGNPSFNVGDKVIYQGREMIITNKDFHGELRLKPVSPNLSGIKNICKLLSVNRTLKSLNLSVLDLSTVDLPEKEMNKQTSVGRAGALALYRILSENRSLTSLKFENNNVGAYNVNILVGDALKVNPCFDLLTSTTTTSDPNGSFQ